jgi:hypothetical protein
LEGERLNARRLTSGALCFAVLCTFAACTSETPAKTSTTSTTKAKNTTSTTTTAPAGKSAWLEQWQPTLLGAYGPAQSAFLQAVGAREPAAIEAAAPGLVAANAALRDAITKAGPPPESDAASATLLVSALNTEAALLQTVESECTAKTDACANALAEYAKNNRQKILVLLTDLGAAS